MQFTSVEYHEPRIPVLLLYMYTIGLCYVHDRPIDNTQAVAPCYGSRDYTIFSSLSLFTSFRTVYRYTRSETFQVLFRKFKNILHS